MAVRLHEGGAGHLGGLTLSGHWLPGTVGVRRLLPRSRAAERQAWRRPQGTVVSSVGEGPRKRPNQSLKRTGGQRRFGVPWSRRGSGEILPPPLTSSVWHRQNRQRHFGYPRAAIDLSTYIWTEYLKHRARSRGFDLAIIEQILRFSPERYLDTVTRRMVAVGRHGQRLVIVPYDQEGDIITPVTIHATTRPQINLRLRTGRFIVS